MANLNPVAVIRDVSSSPQHTREVHVIVGRVTGGGSDTVTVETKLKSIISAVVIKENSTTAVLATTIGNSSTYPGTKTVAFTVANLGEYSYQIVGLLNRTATTDTTSGAMTVTYLPLNTGD